MQTFTFKSSNEINTVQGYIFECENPKAILQISHGMCEYFLRYTKFAEYMNKNGFIVCGNDHIGHGKSISKTSDRGFFAQNNGHNYLIDDLHKVTTVIKEKYPNLPLILLGHSMGSLILRYYLTKYAYELNGAIICGTIGPNPTNKISKLICNIFVKIKGAKTPSPFLDTMAFGSFNKKISPLKTEKDWLTRDSDIVNKYINDENCMFVFTTSAFRDVSTLLDIVSKKMPPQNLPVLMISGKEDPCGDYGKGILKLYNMYNKSIKDLTLKLYEGCRHEILNELNNEEIYSDINIWCQKHI